MRHKIMIVATLFAAASLSSGCAKQTFVIDSADSSMYSNYGSHMSNFILQGIAQKDVVYTKDICGREGGVSMVSTHETFTDAILSILSFGIYTPRHYEVYCRRKK